MGKLKADETKYEGMTQTRSREYPEKVRKMLLTKLNAEKEEEKKRSVIEAIMQELGSCWLLDTELEL